MICERCGKEHDGSFGSGRFCSRKCANTRELSSSTKKKIADSVKNTIGEKEREGKVCKKCGKIFHSRELGRYLCYDCLPKVIKYNEVRKSRPRSIKEVSSRTISKIMLRAKLPCSCCNFYVPDTMLDIHHIIPKKDGGTDDMNNLTYICPNCHRIAHTDVSKLPNSLISIEQQLKEKNLVWTDFYYGFKSHKEE